MKEILLIPGFMCTKDLWADMHTGVEMIGRLHYGDLSEGDSINEISSRILACAPERFILVGFSLGGYIAREIALQAPHRVESLILINTSARPSTPSEIRRNREQRETAQDVCFTGISRRGLLLALHPDQPIDEDLIHKLQAMSSKLGKQVFIRQLGLEREDGYAGCTRITCPCLIIASDRDQLRFIDEAIDMAGAIPHSTLRIIADCGHMLPLEQPVKLTSLIADWISRNP
jgi:pimeloyl-ACP methyl ester carboxylesterase